MQLPHGSEPETKGQPAAPAKVKAPAPRRWGRWVGLLLVAAAAAGVYWYQTGQIRARSAATIAAVRTHVVAAGPVVQTLRLTGTTSAERYASLLAPQLRGSRGGFGRDARSFRSSTRGSNVSANTGTGSTSQSAASMAGGSGGSSGSGAATGIAGSRAATGVQNMTSRVSRSSSGGSRSSGSQSAAAAASAAMGEGLGSTSNSLSGGSSGPGAIGSASSGGGGGGGGGRGGRGGGGEFSLVLQDATPPGKLVKKGDVVAEFDRQYMLTRLDDYRAAVAQTDSNFKKLLSELELTKKAHDQTIDVAKANFEKAQLDMKTLPVLGAMDAERRRLALEEAEAQLKQVRQEIKFMDTGLAADRKVAELEVRQSELELQRNERNVDRMVLKAPIDGLVVMMTTFRGAEFDQIKVGDQVYAGMRFMQIVDPSSMVVNATVSQAYVEQVRYGQKAKIRFDAFPGLELTAHISAIGTVASASRYRPDWVRDIPVVLKLDEMDRRVIPDLSVSCDVILETEEAPAIAPLEAVHTEAAPGQQARHFVWVRGTQGAWQRREVELGIENNVRVAVRRGLKAGETIALERPPQARDTSTVSLERQEAERPPA
ncbi:MAG: efflux RND transporter periplasmic adaptor subunit [Bryobacteraceae bacterium]